MDVKNKATQINLFSLKTPQMRAFHMSWFAFFLCFFAWFGIAPLMAVVREELGLTKEQIGNTIIASVAITIVARLLHRLAVRPDRPARLPTPCLLMVGSLPVMAIGLGATTTRRFLLFRLGIGVIGASFVITQYHTSVMFAPNVVGTANATSAGWGNLGGGVTQMVMPLVFAAFVGLGFTDAGSWRLSMVVAGAVCFADGYRLLLLHPGPARTATSRTSGPGASCAVEEAKGTVLAGRQGLPRLGAVPDLRACFGIELTINNIAALYYMDYFDLGLKTAGLVAGLFGLMNIFARTTRRHHR